MPLIEVTLVPLMAGRVVGKGASVGTETEVLLDEERVRLELCSWVPEDKLVALEEASPPPPQEANKSKLVAMTNRLLCFIWDVLFCFFFRRRHLYIDFFPVCFYVWSLTPKIDAEELLT